MSKIPDIKTDDRWIISNRGTKNPVDPFKPYGWLVEKERTASGTIEDTGIIFLTNRECAFHCLMCDLWKNTTDNTVPVGAIPAQIEFALETDAGIETPETVQQRQFLRYKGHTGRMIMKKLPHLSADSKL